MVRWKWSHPISWNKQLSKLRFFLRKKIRQIFLPMKYLPARLLNSCHHPINCEMSDFSQNMCERLGNYFSPHMIVSTTMDPSYFFQSVLFFHCQTIKVRKYVCSKCIQFSKNILLFILGKILHYFGQTFWNLKQMAMHNIRKKKDRYPQFVPLKEVLQTYHREKPSSTLFIFGSHDILSGLSV